ncbi:putative D-beta-hydroxybutyrate dehydrogenase, mitochondrial [Hypsibius exemplaris]|uniref:D-beta-hydroxybutyrate dehydrogenase, mitochondrial n=1 Tax=Hypsibius exemplaris TaxID=2072580 RepID=A0A9X6RKF5_HYPEX|nr:putative D-beta-hydroxybutyrate dehydrogenase, mitochondrial [Hypsibius exemplaris]
MDLQKIRGPAIFAASFIVVYLLCCVPLVALLVGYVGKIVVSTFVGVTVSFFLKSQLDKLFNGDRKTTVNPSRKAVFISGCDTGFGHELALRLHRLGFYVYAGCLFPDQEGGRKLRERGSDGRLRVVACDVTDTRQVNECAQRIREELQKLKIDLWAVVNNAGVASLSEFEWIPTEVYEKILNVNSLGSVRVIKAFLPQLRQKCGRIVIVASLSGRYAIPGFTGYSMSKHAQVALADGLRRELRKFNIQVCLVEPGSYKTQLADSTLIMKEVQRHWELLSEETKTSYTPEYYENFISHLGILADDTNPNISEPVDAIVEAVTSTSPRLRYVPGTFAVKLRGFFMPLLPSRVQDLLLSKLSIGLLLPPSADQVE